MQDRELKEALQDWRAMVKPYQTPHSGKAIVQIINTFIPFLGLLVATYLSLKWSYLITLGLSAVTAFWLVRLFIIQHDCGHQSFLGSRRWNNVIGYICSFCSTVPYRYWSSSHSAHHATNSQLEHRGLGDIHFLTAQEYDSRSAWGKFRYRIFRMPVVMFFVIPVIYLVFSMRYPLLDLKGWKKMRAGFILNNILIGLFYLGLVLLLGWKSVLLVQVPVLLMFIVIAFWFFYIQHQHEDNYNEWKDKWDHLLASIRGSTFYKLPRVFQWLSGNIGFHHIHHLNSRIPNYHLEACAKAHPILSEYVNVLDFRGSLKCIHYKLWDEESQRMIGFREFEANKARREKISG